jgi:hypothetical protein
MEHILTEFKAAASNFVCEFRNGVDVAKRMGLNSKTYI